MQHHSLWGCGAASLDGGERAFLAAANGEADYQPWMGYANFVSNGNAENCSPNPLFNVMEYLTAKANQLNALDEGAGYEGSNAGQPNPSSGISTIMA